MTLICEAFDSSGYKVIEIESSVLLKAGWVADCGWARPRCSRSAWFVCARNPPFEGHQALVWTGPSGSPHCRWTASLLERQYRKMVVPVMAEEPETLSNVLDRLQSAARENKHLSIERITQTFGERSYGPFLIIPALIEMTPIGGVPGLPTFLAIIILLLAIQMVFRRRHLWMPGWIARRSVSGKKFGAAAQKLRPLAARLDHWFHGRLPALTSGPFVRIAAACSVLLTFTVPPLELIPFASTVPMLAIALFGMALLVRDGALLVVAGGLTIAAFGLVGYFLLHQ